MEQGWEDLNGNLNGNLGGHMIGDLDRNLNGNQPGTKQGLNLNQKGVLRGSLEGPWGSLGGPWGSLDGSLGDQTGTQDWSGKCLKCITVVKNRPGDKRPGSERYQILGPP